MKANVLYLVFFLFSGLCYSQQRIPLEVGEKGTFYNQTTKKHHDYTITRNNPYSLPLSGLDFKADFFLSKYTGASIGLNYFKRPDLYHEHHYAAACIVGILNDTSHGFNSTIITTNLIMYSAEYRYTQFFGKQINKHFFGKRIKESVEYVYEEDGTDYKHHPNKRINNTFLAKTLTHYGISYGIQGFAGNIKTVTNQLVNTVNSNNQPVNVNEEKKHVFPFESAVLSVGLERRRSTCWEYKVDGNDKTGSNFELSGSYARLLYAPLLFNKYIGTDMQVHNNFTTFKSHIGFAIGAYFDYGGAFQGTIEAGIMPGFGYYFKVGWPLTEFSLHRSKKNLDGSDYNG